MLRFYLILFSRSRRKVCQDCITCPKYLLGSERSGTLGKGGNCTQLRKTRFWRRAAATEMLPLSSASGSAGAGSASTAGSLGEVMTWAVTPLQWRCNNKYHVIYANMYTWQQCIQRLYSEVLCWLAFLSQYVILNCMPRCNFQHGTRWII